MYFANQITIILMNKTKSSLNKFIWGHTQAYFKDFIKDISITKKHVNVYNAKI